MNVRLQPIDAIGLSVRSQNALQKAGVHTVGDMLDFTQESLLEIRNLGQKSVEEILSKIKIYRQRVTEEELRGNEQPKKRVINNFTDLLNDKDGKDFVIFWLRNKEIKIEELDLMSLRAYRLLIVNNYHFLHQIVFLGKTGLMEIARMDDRSASGLSRLCEQFLKDKADAIMEEYAASHVESQLLPVSVFDLMGIPKFRECIRKYLKAHDCSINNLGLSDGAVNSLKNAGHSHISDLLELEQSDIMQLPHIGSVGAAKILGKVHEYLSLHEEEIMACCSENGEAPIFDTLIREQILSLYKDRPFSGLSLEDFIELLKLPKAFSQDRLKKIIGGMLARHELEYVDFRCYKVYGKFSELFEACDCIDDRTKNMINRRLEGETLDAIGLETGLTKERVRQIVKKGVQKVCKWYHSATGMDKFDEDYYEYLFKTYAFDKKDAFEWLGITPSIYNYLLFIRDVNRGERSIHDALDDYHNLDMSLRLKIKNYLNRNKLFVDGRWIEKRRGELEKFVARKLCTDDVSFTNFVEIFNGFLKSQNVENDEDIYCTEAVYSSRQNCLSNSRFILWKQNEMMRYYDIDAHDFTELLDVLNLDVYENIEFSTAKLMRNYPDIMKKYDIRDQYELHNLLRKIVPKGSYHDFHCGRMPTIQFGKFNRNDAVLDILIDNAPISKEGLCEILHEEFGYDHNVIVANFLAPLSDYYHNGIYTIDDKLMPLERRERLLSGLTEDFYYIAEIRDFYSKLFPEADPEEVNPYNLKSMGFSVLSRYVLRNYSSLDEFFETLLASDNEVDLVPLRKRFGYVQAFSSTLMEMKKSLHVVEFEPNRILSFHLLDNRGITLEKVRKFCDSVFDFVENGAYFSICSLKNNGFESELFDMGFSDWFYANLLISDERFSYCKMLGTIILYKGHENISIKSFAMLCIERHGSINVNELIDELKNKFGCKVVDRADVLYKLADSGVHYDKIFDRLYASQDVYYRELVAEGI